MDDEIAMIMLSSFGEVCTIIQEIAEKKEDKFKEITFEFQDVVFTLSCKVKEDAK